MCLYVHPLKKEDFVGLVILNSCKQEMNIKIEEFIQLKGTTKEMGSGDRTKIQVSTQNMQINVNQLTKM